MQARSALLLTLAAKRQQNKYASLTPQQKKDMQAKKDAAKRERNEFYSKLAADLEPDILPLAAATALPMTNQEDSDDYDVLMGILEESLTNKQPSSKGGKNNKTKKQRRQIYKRKSYKR